MKTFASICTTLGLSLLTGAALAQSNAGGTLRINTTDADDSFTIRFLAQTGRIQLFGVPGYRDGQVLNNIRALIVNTRGGTDNVFIHSVAAVMPSLTIDTGSGNSVVDIDLQVPVTASPVTSQIRVTGGAQNDQVFFRTVNGADDFRGNWIVSAGDGENDTQALLSSQDPTSFIGVAFNVFGGSGVDKMLVDTTTQSRRLALTLDGNLGGNRDEQLIKANGLPSSEVTLGGSISMGDELDRVNWDFTQWSSLTYDGSVTTGAGDDLFEANLEALLLGSGTVNMGLGNDVTKIVVKGTVAGSPRWNAEEGDDLVEFYADAITGDPLSDGGPGIDTFFGVGRIVNFEN